MKIVLIAAAFVVIFCSANLLSQDWAKVNPEMNNIVLDTSLVRATVATIEPGMKSALHTHPAHVFYALTDGKIKVHYKNSEAVTLEFKAGDCGFGSPEMPHQTENLGTVTVKILLVELKDHPYIGEK